MRCLRALPRWLVGELREEDDFSLAQGGELLATPFRVCFNPQCPCRRCFVGTATREATTLAVVTEEDPAEAFEEFASSALATHWWAIHREAASEEHFARLSAAAEPFEPGRVVRVETVDNTARLYSAGAVMEDAVGE